jgi:hypothetical protein
MQFSIAEVAIRTTLRLRVEKVSIKTAQSIPDKMPSCESHFDFTLSPTGSIHLDENRGEVDRAVSISYTFRVFEPTFLSQRRND